MSTRIAVDGLGPRSMSALSEADVVLRDGSTAHLREAGPGDVVPLRHFLGELSERSRWFRFFSTASDLDPMARWSAGDDDMGGRAVVATSGPAGEIVGQGRYVPWENDQAEVAFAVADAWQGHGIATILLAHLARAAADQGVMSFMATVLPANHRMIGVFRKSGFPVEVHSGPGVLEITLPTALTPEARSAFEARDRIAAAEAVRTVLRPSAVALVGASERPGSVGQALLRNLVGGFRGDLHLVSPHGGMMAGHRAYASVLAIPGPVELAVIAVPAAAVLDVARECAHKGVRALVVVLGRVRRGGHGREGTPGVSCCRSAGPAACGWWGPTASGSSTPMPACT